MRTRTDQSPSNAAIFCGTEECWKRDTPSKPWYRYPPADSNHIYTGCTSGNNRQFKNRRHCIDELHSGPPYYSGGPFDLISGDDGGQDVKMHGVYTQPLTSPSSCIKTVYKGGFICTKRPPISGTGLNIFNTPSSTILKNSTNDATPYGPTGWKKFQPLKPGVELGVSIGEIRDMIPMFKKTAKRFIQLYKVARKGNKNPFSAKSVSGDWLTYQFGWLPFLSDIMGFIRTTQKLKARLDRLRDFNGQWERRGGIVYRNDDSADIESGSNWSFPVLNSAYQALVDYGPYMAAKSKTTLTTQTKIWFEGRFRYWLPEHDLELRWPPRLIAQLYGLSLTPALLWELMPWSWMIDWVSNVGDVISNASTLAEYNLATSYAYVMAHQRKVYNISVYRPIGHGAMRTISWTYPVERKHRVEASSPFGFDVQWDGLSLRQLSILAALGISRLPNS